MELKHPRRWPPDRVLAENGFVRRLFERITGQRDVVERRVNGRAVFTQRKPATLSGMPSKISDEIHDILDCAVGYYKSHDCEIYVVHLDHDFCVAEALKDGKHFWSAKEKSLRNLLDVVYHLFPKAKPTTHKPETDPDKMELQHLEKLLARKRAEYMEKMAPSLPAADVDRAMIEAASDPEIIAREREEGIKDMKMVPDTDK